MSFNIWNRRYTGSKYKLVSWIDNLIQENCVGTSFCDIFSGTGVVAAAELEKFNKIIVNDFLFSNNVIYKAFFLQETYDFGKMKEYSDIWMSQKVNDLPDNFFSLNYGGKYFSCNDAKKIGYIRQCIENCSNDLNIKEKSILLCSLVYSADRIANTVGHYDAYIKGKKIDDRFEFDFITPYQAENTEIEIYRMDANKLSKQITCDIVYIDPPYNSRQYSRFYHILETLVKWDSPALYGEALKPPAENMSDYCRISAINVFSDLIMSLKCKYIVVSYNNTYHSKSNSSKNKMKYEDIISVLEKRGKVQVFEKKHQFFNTGKTDFDDHKEYIFIVEAG